MNTKTPAISILVPVYKVEAYLQRCIDSVLTQDFQDWEMILVDDGSPDHCPLICDEAAEKDARISVVHKENGGLPSARLAGFERARGEYLVFLDADDYLLLNALKDWIDIISRGYDIVRSAVWRTDADDCGEEARYKTDRGVIFGKDNYFLALIRDDVAPYLHSAIYKKSLFDRDVFQKIIDGKISIAEDWIANILIAPRVNKVYFSEKPAYAYARNEESMMNTRIRSRAYQDRFDTAWMPVLEKMSESVRRQSYDLSIIKRIRFFFVPELEFSFEDYHKISLCIGSISKDFLNVVPSKYLYFIQYKMLYYVYTRLYCLLYKYKKLHGVKRAILD